MDRLKQNSDNCELSVIDHLPEGLLDCPVNALDSVLAGPTLIRLRGKRQPSLFVSVLLHGNETTGFLAVQELLKRQLEKGPDLPRGLSLFIGNITAAKYGVRRLPGQVDYNRIWAEGSGAEYAMAQQLLSELATEPPFAAIDIHNNSGQNPLYACINRTDAAYVNLASAFSKTLVYFTEPHQVIAMALSRLCPTTTLECGLPGQAEGLERVLHYLENCLQWISIDNVSHLDEETDVFHTVGRITVAESDRIGFDTQGEYELRFPEELETLNFRLLPADSTLGWRFGSSPGLSVTDNDGRDVSDRYIHYRGNRILTRKPCLLSMLTRDVRVIYQDCLGYVMEHYPLEALRASRSRED